MRSALFARLVELRAWALARFTAEALRFYFIGRRVYVHHRNGLYSVEAVETVIPRGGTFFVVVDTLWRKGLEIDIRRGNQDPKTKFWHFHEE